MLRPTEAVRQYVLDRFTEAVEALRDGQGDKEAIDGWRSMLGAGRMRSNPKAQRYMNAWRCTAHAPQRSTA
jgi:hypothetical protein